MKGKNAKIMIKLLKSNRWRKNFRLRTQLCVGVWVHKKQRKNKRLSTNDYYYNLRVCSAGTHKN